jgi:hypothetical protein
MPTDVNQVACAVVNAWLVQGDDCLDCGIDYATFRDQVVPILDDMGFDVRCGEALDLDDTELALIKVRVRRRTDLTGLYGADE